MNKEAKILIASLIRESKEILFGKLSETLTHEVKQNEWKIIFNKAQSQGLISSSKDWKYLRDVIWQNLKRPALHKINNAEISEYGPSPQFTDLDNIVIDIIGKGSTIPVDICKYSESSLQNSSDEDENLLIELKNIEPEKEIRDFTSRKRIIQESNSDKDSIIDLKKKKLRLEIYILQLDAMKRERELGLKMSKF